MIWDAYRPPEGTIRDWLNFRASSGTVAFIFPETHQTLTWHDLRNKAQDFALQLTEYGLVKGESFAIVSPNGHDAIIALFGALFGGFRATMINLAAGRDAIAYALDHCEARFAFVHESSKDVFSSANPSNIRRVNITDRTETDANKLHDITCEDHALLMYTSGTTGTPKGVVHTHSSLLAGGWTSAVAHKLQTSDRGFCVLPMYHINGLCVTIMGSLVSGGSLTMTSRFSASRFWQHASDTHITWFSVVPTIISHLLHGQHEPDAASIARIRFGRSASSALAIETQSAFETRFSIPIVETMGLTETAAQILSNPLPPGERKIGSPGISYGCDIQIHDSNGVPVPPNTEGEIVVRGPNVMREYLKNPKATDATFRNGWLKTGDLAHVDSDGYVFVTGRLKELIIKGGENIAPREIDEILYSHPDVIEAAAFARACSRYGETVEAAVRVRTGSTLTSKDLLELCSESLGSFKSPDTIHFMDELPKGPSGKIQRLKLAELIP